MAKDLSTKQHSILGFIRAFIEQHDYPPSIRQIQEGCRISSTSVVDYNLKALERQGFIRRDREVSRAIEVLERGGRRPRTWPSPSSVASRPASPSRCPPPIPGTAPTTTRSSRSPAT